MSMITSRNTRSLNAINTADFIVIRRGPGGISIEAHEREDDWSSVTVGPFDLGELRATLDRLAATPSLLGSYSRTDAPDLLDGGVTAAAIEKETEDPGGPLDETADFWRARWKEAADRADARDLAAHQWKEATRENIARFRAARDFAEMCQKGSRAATARAEKAERERDEWKDSAIKAMADLERAEQPRPLTAREHLSAAWEAAHVPADGIIPAGADYLWRSAVTGRVVQGTPDDEAASTGAGGSIERRLLDSPSARPEWADIEDVLNVGWPEGINGSDNGYIARTLHEGGVRVTGADR
ncbi:hypothetical protein [Brachybacterium massiliense]|uniref:hypothetical protein n=1 Tax=Brachybacterium massiliense TaxID=1755098 RepID=UPI000B3BAC8C|nr:hypothetical protein [Brachybacterium massiliense]